MKLHYSDIETMNTIHFSLFCIFFFFTTVLTSPVKNNFLEDDVNLCKQVCHTIDPDKINVHLIPHSHDDVGWLKTVEEYYYGMNDTYQNVGVQYIIDSVLQALKQNPERRYIQVETAFFWKWWNYQNSVKQDLFKSFVNNGQIEMVGGGWSMNDEACTNYQSTINQMTWGLRLLNDTLGECGKPRIGWQIDPFGHSREQASIFRQLGYDAIFFVRLSRSDKNNRFDNKNLEFWWQSSNSLDNSNIFTSIFSTDSYYSPNGFCWDYLQCNADAINDDPESFDYNLDDKLRSFGEIIQQLSGYFKTKNILIPIGGDFQYQSAERNFINIDKLIKGFKDNEDFNVFYSSPSCYYSAVSDASSDLAVYSGDFFPYAENENAYWAGYFTSRPTVKRFERVGNNVLHVVNQLTSFEKMTQNNESINYEENIRSLREIMGTMQHHDAVTGTEKQHVSNNYVKHLSSTIKQSINPIGEIIGNLLKKDNVSENIVLPISSCLLTNISICENSVKDKFMVTVYNPLARSVTYYVRLPSQNATYKITGPDGTEVYDIVSHMHYPVEADIAASEAELIFAARNIPPMGIKFYYIEKLEDTYKPNTVKVDNKTFGTSEVSFTLDDNNLLSSVKMNDKILDINQKFMAYVGNNGSGNGIASGAYLFRPINGSDAYHIDYTEDGANETTQKSISVTFNRGNLVDEVIQVFNNFVSQTIRVYKGEDNNFIEFDWLVGPLDNDTVNTTTHQGKEVITRFYVNDFENDIFYTDSNGREMIERKRTDYPYKNSSFEPVASNYYPVTSKISIRNEDKDIQVSVLTDRSQGGASLWGGEMELMVHRRTLKDDYKGVDETLEEQEFGEYLVVRGQHYLILGSTNTTTKDKTIKSTTAQERELALKKLLQPLVLIGDASSKEWSLENIQLKINFEWSGLKSALPDNVHILSLEPWKDNSYLLRLEHILEKDEDANYSKEITVDIGDIFSPYLVSSVQETTLGANELLTNTKSSWRFKGDSNSVYDFDNPSYSQSAIGTRDGSTQVLLTPMQIRTFIVEVEK